MSKRRKPCKPGCISFCKLPVGSYFSYCGKIVEGRVKRGEPFAGYKKVSGPKTVRGKHFAGGAVEMLLKKRGWGKKAAIYRPVRGCPCVRRLGRDFAVQHAERRAKFSMARKGRARKVA